MGLYKRGKVWWLQTRNAKRSGFAAVRIAVDMVDEGIISRDEAFSSKRLSPNALEQFLRPVFPKGGTANKLLARGIGAGPGVASGRICFHASDAEELWTRFREEVESRANAKPEVVDMGMDII